MTDQRPGQPDWRGMPIGTLIAGYRLEEQIGAGGMAVVFRAYDTRLDRQVALKLLAPGLDMDTAARQRFVRESRAAAAVDDPHIIPVFDAGEAGGVLYIAMRYVRGGDVRALVDRSGPLPAGRVAEIVRQAAAALDAAHARGLVHRDVKPANMLVESREGADPPDHLYLSDFGLTKAAAGSTGALTATGQFIGTLDYVAPEQITGRPLDGRCDQYALACSAFELLCGQPPFRREQSLSVMYAHLHDPPPQLALLRSGLPGGLNGVLARALAKDPAGRYGSCGEFAAALREVLGAARPAAPARPAQPAVLPPVPAAASPAAAAPGTAGLTRPAGVPAADPGPRRPLLGVRAVLAALAALAVLAGGGYLLASHHSRAAGAADPARSPSAVAAAPPLAVPGCTDATAAGQPLGSVSSGTTGVPGAFGIAVSTHYAFVIGDNAVTILKPAGTTLARIATIPVPGGSKSGAVTHDGQYLLVAKDSGAAVLSVADALDHGSSPVRGMLTGSGGNLGADEVVISPDDRYAFVSLQTGTGVAVFNLQQAAASGFTQSGFLGTVPVPDGPTGLAAAGGLLFATSEGGKTISLISMKTAEQHPARAVLRRVAAGCGPARAAVGPAGQELWVTATTSDAVLGYSTARLAKDPDHALNAVVEVGESPLGVAVADAGKRLIVVDSDQAGGAGHATALTVVDTAKAVSHQPAVLGSIPTGRLPRDAVLSGDGQTVLVAVSNSGQVQAVSVGSLP